MYRSTIQKNKFLRKLCRKYFTQTSKYGIDGLSQNDFVGRLHIPKDEADIQKQLEVLGKSHAFI